MPIKPVQFIKITSDYAEQRLDNYLFNYLKNIPKSRIYQMLRKGEVRVNKGRKPPSYKLQENDLIRIPPLFQEEVKKQHIHLERFQYLLECIVYENDDFLVLNKPSGIAVHAGSHDPIGVVEALKQLRNDLKSIELAHRIDKDTSGCLILAKKRSSLRKLHDMFRTGQVKKTYYALTLGRWDKSETYISAPLDKFNFVAGERLVKASDKGKSAQTQIKLIKPFNSCSLIEAKPETGRMHQIRVHCAIKNHPIAGDQKYGDAAFNKMIWKLGLRRLFLHAFSLEFLWSQDDKPHYFETEIPNELKKILHLIEASQVKK